MKKYSDNLLYKIISPIIKMLFIFIYKPNIINKENIPLKGRIILAGNHINNYDCILLMCSTKRQIHFLAKKELFDGLKGKFFSRMGLISVDRSKKNPQAIIDAVEYLNNEKVIGIFPEGTTEKGRGLMPFKIGSVRIANQSNSKIIPFKIIGEYKPFKRSVSIVFGTEISYISDSILKENAKLKDIVANLKES